MSRRPNLIAKKKQKVRVTRSESYLINFKYLGDEPLDVIVTQTDYIKALNWYTSMCDRDDARNYLKDYFQDHKDYLKLINKIPDIWIPYTTAWKCRMITRGIKSFEEEDHDNICDKLVEAASHGQEEKVVVKFDNKPSIQDRMRERGHDIVGEIESKIDSGEAFSVYDWLKSNEIPAAYCNTIIEKYAPWLDELLEAHEGKDEQLKEGYKNFTKKQLHDRIMFFNKLIEDVEKYAGVVKKTRAPRKPRPVSTEKKLKNLKYQKESAEFKIASINPEKIIGAQELWTFNTKYKVVTVFRALDRGGLQVKGTSIINYDEANSFSKGTGRKPEVVLDKLRNGGKVVLRKLMEELKTDKDLQHRINENTILMRVQ